MDAETETAYTDFEAFYTHAQPLLLLYLKKKILLMAPRIDTGANAAATDAGVDGHVAEDVAQQVWLNIWANWPKLRFTDQRHAGGYLYRSADHLLVDYMRRTRALYRKGYKRINEEAWHEVSNSLPDTRIGGQPESVLDLKELYATLREALGRCHTRQEPLARDLAILEAELKEEPLAVTSERMAISVSALKTHRWRIRQALRDALPPEYAEGRVK